MNILTHEGTVSESSINAQQNGPSWHIVHLLGHMGVCFFQNHTGKRDFLKVCDYGQFKRQWKNKCPALKVKVKYSGGVQVKPVALASSVVSPQVVVQNEQNSDALCATV